MLTESVKGMKLEDVARLSQDAVLENVGIGMSPTRMKCALLGLKVSRAPPWVRSHLVGRRIVGAARRTAPFATHRHRVRRAGVRRVGRRSAAAAAGPTRRRRSRCARRAGVRTPAHAVPGRWGLLLLAALVARPGDADAACVHADPDRDNALIAALLVENLIGPHLRRRTCIHVAAPRPGAALRCTRSGCSYARSSTVRVTRLSNEGQPHRPERFVRIAAVDVVHLLTARRSVRSPVTPSALVVSAARATAGPSSTRSRRRRSLMAVRTAASPG